MLSGQEIKTNTILLVIMKSFLPHLDRRNKLMQKYDGQLVYQTHDDEGIIEVVDTDGVRALHFGSPSRQSSMSLTEPDSLHSLYARTMMALLLFKDKPVNILMIGLGGGTIARYLLNHFPLCKIHVVEFRRSVVKVARSHFGLPIDARLKIKIGCGAEHIAAISRKASQQYDLIVVDAFDHEGMEPKVANENFFDGCRTLLKEDGLFAMNLWGTHADQFQQVAWNIGRIFDWRSLYLPVRRRGNIIAFAFTEHFIMPSIKQLQQRAIQLEHTYHLEFCDFVKDIKRNNSKVIKKVLS